MDSNDFLLFASLKMFKHLIVISDTNDIFANLATAKGDNSRQSEEVMNTNLIHLMKFMAYLLIVSSSTGVKSTVYIWGEGVQGPFQPGT